MTDVKETGERRAYELACQLFYAVHWFGLSTADLARILEGSALVRLEQLIALTEALSAAFAADSNAPIEEWCVTGNSQLAGRSPSALVKEGDLQSVAALIPGIAPWQEETP